MASIRAVTFWAGNFTFSHSTSLLTPFSHSNVAFPNTNSHTVLLPVHVFHLFHCVGVVLACAGPFIRRSSILRWLAKSTLFDIHASIAGKSGSYLTFIFLSVSYSFKSAADGNISTGTELLYKLSVVWFMSCSRVFPLQNTMLTLQLLWQL